jgi:hypothetical protein
MKTHYWYITRKDGENIPSYGLPTFLHDDLFSRDEISQLNDLAKPYRQLKLSPDQVRSACINKLRNPVVEGIEPPTPTDVSPTTDGGTWI